MPSVAAMPAVTSMHKKMREETAKQECERQIWGEMLTVINYDVESTNYEETN